jgi:hypothetical protein
MQSAEGKRAQGSEQTHTDTFDSSSSIYAGPTRNRRLILCSGQIRHAAPAARFEDFGTAAEITLTYE